MVADSSQDRYTSVAFARDVLLPDDVVALKGGFERDRGSTGDATSSGKSCDLGMFQVTFPIFDIFCFLISHSL